MKPVWLAGTALLALLALDPAAQAQRVTFTYEPPGSIVTWTVPATGLYQITAYGAQGGNALYYTFVGPGGLGAEIGGNFTLTAGEILQIAVGGKGADPSGGGGGGSFVVGPGNEPLVIAGGGGGGYFDWVGDTLPGGAGLTGTVGGDGNGIGNSAGGINGNGGAGAGGVGGGGGGAGFYGDGGTATYSPGYTYGTGGTAFPTLTGGSKGGGWGGGGGYWDIGMGASGGGGGYSGGGGGFRSSGQHGGGGGGGSFNAGIDQIQVAGIQSGDGEVVINTIFVGTPGKPNCHGEVVSNLAKQYGGLDAAAAALGYSSVQVLQNAIATYCAGSIG